MCVCCGGGGALWEFLLGLRKSQATSGTLSPAFMSRTLGELLGSSQLAGDFCGNWVEVSGGSHTFMQQPTEYSTFTQRENARGIYLVSFVEVFQYKSEEV